MTTMRFSFAKIWLPLTLLVLLIVGGAGRGYAQGEADLPAVPGAAHAEESRPVFEPEHGTWFNGLTRGLFRIGPTEHQQLVESAHKRVEENQPLTAAETTALEKSERINAAVEQKAPVTEKLSSQEAHDAEFAATYNAALAQKNGKELTAEQEKLLTAHPVVKMDFLVVTAILWTLLAVALVSVARKRTIRPEGKAASFGNTVEAAVEAFQDYLIGVMGEPLGRKYTAFIATFFFTILVSNWLGLIPGMLAPSSIPAIPIALAIVGFVMVHVFAIKEAGLKSWFMHFVGEPIWLAPLNFPLHIVGELIKPLSLSLRLLCNVFGEEQVVATLTLMAVTLLPIWLPIPLQFPMLILGTFFGFLQALVFSTLLAIYIAIFATHHDDGHGHPSTEHAVDNNGHHKTVGHPAEMMVG